MPQNARPTGRLLDTGKRAPGALVAPASGGKFAAGAAPLDPPSGLPLPSATCLSVGPGPADSACVHDNGNTRPTESTEASEATADQVRVDRLQNIGWSEVAPINDGEVQADQVLAMPGRSLLLVGPHDAHPDMPRIADALRMRGYPVTCIAPQDCQELARALQAQPVRVVVMHVGLLDTIELHQMVQLRRERGSIHWVLAWHSQSPRWVELVVYLQARGCIDCDDPRSFGRAIDSVIAGDLWFPRWLTHALYFTLLAAVREARIDAAQSLGETGTTLTKREAEALELMRQGLTNKEIARRLLVSVNTVKKHLKNAFDKRGLHSRRQGLC